MPLTTELDDLATWVKRLPSIGIQTLGGAGASMHVLDFIMIGAVKRSLSLASGMLSMVQAHMHVRGQVFHYHTPSATIAPWHAR